MPFQLSVSQYLPNKRSTHNRNYSLHQNIFQLSPLQFTQSSDQTNRHTPSKDETIERIRSRYLEDHKDHKNDTEITLQQLLKYQFETKIRRNFKYTHRRNPQVNPITNIPPPVPNPSSNNPNPTQPNTNALGYFDPNAPQNYVRRGNNAEPKVPDQSSKSKSSDLVEFGERKTE